MYGLTDQDLRIRDIAREFVETLMPYEVEAELAGGLLPKEVTAEHRARAIELGLYATNMPTSIGGPGCTALQQVLVQEQCGRVTNGLGWVMATPPQWWAEVATDDQLESWLLPPCAARSTRRTRSPRSSPGPTCRHCRPPRVETATSTSSTASSGTSPRSTWPTTSSSRRCCPTGARGRSRIAGRGSSLAGCGSRSHAAVFAQHRR